MRKPAKRDAREKNAPAVPVTGDATERHLLKSRELLRQVHARLAARDAGAHPADNDDDDDDDDTEEP